MADISPNTEGAEIACMLEFGELAEAWRPWRSYAAISLLNSLRG